MANTRISDLTAGAAIADTDLFPDVQTVGVGPVKVTATQLKTYTSASPTLVTPNIGVASGTSLALGTASTTTGTLTIATSGGAGTGTIINTGTTTPIFQFGGADAAAPVAQSFSMQSVATGTADTSGVALNLYGSKGTGNKNGGSLIFRTYLSSGVSGSVQNTSTNSFTLTGAGVATWATAANATNTFAITSSSSGSSAAAATYFTNDASIAGYIGIHGSGTGAGIGYANTMLFRMDGAAGMIFMAANASGLMKFFSGGTANANERMRITAAGNIYSAVGTAPTTTMTDGFFYIPSAAGAPTGVPTAIANHVPMYYDTTNERFYVYNGAWKSVTLA